MKKIYVLLLLVTGALSACDIDATHPVTITSLEGQYKTNGFLDPLCIAITDERQLPSLEIKKQSNGQYLITRTTFIPQKDIQTLSGVRVQAASDSVKLFYQNQSIGYYTTTEWYNGKKEVKSPVLRISYTDPQTQSFMYFAGVKK
ncbi:hypothetical protein [Telluribacter humicola]|uniref:hypothetical protein n=1 Tax=Telluribacter humicola TaxID=1720261 RepID=UPI001A95C39D|nr:hypothetical protein [Telluribacter humicola]